MDITQFVTEPAKANEAFHGILYGESGCGKTSTLDDDNLKVLLVDMEGGTAVLSEAPNVKRLDVPEIARKTGKTRYEVVLEIGKGIDAGKFLEFDLIAMDSGTAFEDIVKEYIAIKYAPNRRREIEGKFGAQADWGDLKDLTVKTLRWFHTFTKRGDKSQHILWLYHVAKETDEDTKKLIRTKIALQGATTADVVMSVVDGFFYMYNKDVKDEASGEIKVERGIMTKGAVFAAKARQSKRRDPLPAKIVAPVWSEIFETLGYSRK